MVVQERMENARFNGAATSRSRIVTANDKIDLDLARFNGAATSRSRIAQVAVGRVVTDLTLQWGRDLTVADSQ